MVNISFDTDRDGRSGTGQWSDLRLVSRLNHYPKVRWKDSIQEVITKYKTA